MPAVDPVTVLIDVGSPRSPAELQATITGALGRTEETHAGGWLGLAWCLDDHPMPLTIRIDRLEALRARSPMEAKLLLLVLKEVAERRAADGLVIDIT